MTMSENNTPPQTIPLAPPGPAPDLPLDEQGLDPSNDPRMSDPTSLQALIEQAKIEQEKVAKQAELRSLLRNTATLRRSLLVPDATPAPLSEPGTGPASSMDDSASIMSGVEMAMRGKQLPFKTKPPEKFMGRTMAEYRDFIEDVQVNFVSMGLGTGAVTERIVYASSWLGGVPKKLWRNHGGVEQSKKMTWAEFEEFLQNTVQDPVNRALTAQRQFNNAYQGERQSVADFASYLDSLESQLPVDPEEMRTLVLYARLSDSLQTSVAHQGKMPASRRDLIDIASRIENASKPARNRQGKDEKSAKLGDKSRKPRDKSPKRSQQQGFKGYTDSTATRKRARDDRQNERREDNACYRCGSKDHYANKCHLPKPGAGPAVRRSREDTPAKKDQGQEEKSQQPGRKDKAARASQSTST